MAVNQGVLYDVMKHADVGWDLKLEVVLNSL